MLLQSEQKVSEKIITQNLVNNNIPEEQIFLMQILNNEIELFDNDDVMDDLKKVLEL